MNKSTELLEKANATELVSVPVMIEKAIPELAKMLDDDQAAKRFARIITNDCRQNPELFDCTPLSFMGAMFTAAELKLEPVAGRAYLLPFSNSRKVGNEWKKVKEVQLIIGYKGLVELFYRHASSESISWGVVHKNDEFDYGSGSEAFVRHKKALSDRGEKIAYWVGAYVNGRFLFEVKSYADCIAHGEQHSKTFNKRDGKFYAKSPWVTSEDSMCLKTCLIQLSKTLPLSVEMQKAINADETSRHIHPDDMASGKLLNALEAPDQTNWQQEVEDELLETQKETK